jgi:flagellar hook-associated protein 3 FlgL
MIQGFDAIRDTFLANLNSLQARMATTQAQLSSGERVSTASDDPSAVGDILQLEFNISGVKQTQANLNSVKGEVDTAESAIQSAGALLDQARTLGLQGANGTQTASGRAALAQAVQQVLGQLVDISRTSYQGSYVFSGDQSTSPAYALNLASPTGVDRLLNNPSTRLAQDVNGVTFAVSLTAGQIFDHRNPDDSVAPDSVFAALNSLQLALANNDQTGIASALTSLSTAQDHMEQLHSFYGATQNRITNSLDLAQKYQTQWEASLGQVKDTDIAAATTELASENLSQQAALQAQGAMPRSSLFDYLK